MTRDQFLLKFNPQLLVNLMLVRKAAFFSFSVTLGPAYNELRYNDQISLYQIH